MTQAYKILLSNKVEIPIDEDELETVLKAVERGAMCRLRKGIFNPSFLVAVVEDKARMDRFVEVLEQTRKHNDLFPDKQRPVPEGLKPLKDIFKTVKQLT